MNSNSHTHALARFPNLANVKVIVNFTIITQVATDFVNSLVGGVSNPDLEQKTSRINEKPLFFRKNIVFLFKIL